MTRWRTAWAYAGAGGEPRRSSAAAVIVGTILNVIHQGDALFVGRPPDWIKLLLTYIMPYCGATYGRVVSARRARTSSAAVTHDGK